MISKLITLIKYFIPLMLSNNYKNSSNFLNPTLKFCFPTIFYWKFVNRYKKG